MALSIEYSNPPFPPRTSILNALYLLPTETKDNLGVFLLVLSGEAAKADAKSLEGLGPTGS